MSVMVRVRARVMVRPYKLVGNEWKSMEGPHKDIVTQHMCVGVCVCALLRILGLWWQQYIRFFLQILLT